ncbi:MAG: DUF192 domain-containing protein [Candidatus Micrarchaeota archaeon]
MEIYLKQAKKQTVIAKYCADTNFATQFIGLMFSREVKQPLLFHGKGRISIHSFFCPVFDAVFLDEKHRVVKTLTVMPWNSLIAANAFHLIELPSGTIAKYKIKKGDLLTWKEK